MGRLFYIFDIQFGAEWGALHEWCWLFLFNPHARVSLTRTLWLCILFLYCVAVMLSCFFTVSLLCCPVSLLCRCYAALFLLFLLLIFSSAPLFKELEAAFHYLHLPAPFFLEACHLCPQPLVKYFRILYLHHQFPWLPFLFSSAHPGVNFGNIKRLSALSHVYSLVSPPATVSLLLLVKFTSCPATSVDISQSFGCWNLLLWR